MCVFVTWDMSLGCLLHLRCHQWWEDCDLVSLHTLLPGTIIRRAQRGQGAHTELSLCHPGAERVYKRRNTDGSSVSVVKSSTTELRHVCRYYPGGVTESRIWRLIRGVAHHTLRSLDPSSAWGDGTTEYEEQDTCPEYEITHRDEFWGGFIKTKHSYHGTLQIMGHLVSVQSKYSVLCPSVVWCILSFV